MTHVVSHEERGNRGAFFMVSSGERVAEMTYQKLGDTRILIDHTEVQPRLRGQGIARSLLDAAVAWSRQNDMKISATCSYVVAQFARDPSIRDVSG